MSVSRRHVLRTGLATGLAAALPLRALARNVGEAKPAAVGRPRALIYLFCYGGIDAILTTAPRKKADVVDRVHRGYDDADISSVGGHVLGPAFGRLEQFVDRMAIVNGVACQTVAHPNGINQLRQGRRLWPAGSRQTLVDVVGALSPDRPLLSSVHFTPGMVPNDLFVPPSGRSLVVNYRLGYRDQRSGRPLDGLIPMAHALANGKQQRRVVAALRNHRGRGGGSVARHTIAALLDRLRGTQLPAPPPFDPAALRDSRLGAPDARMRLLAEWQGVVRDIAFLLDAGLAATFFAFAPFAGTGWDSHAHNDRNQHMQMALFGYGFEMLLAALESAGLGDQVAIVISSELGRHPFLNEFQGKDHFPEHPVLFVGPGIRAGQYGDLNHTMQAQPISMQTGKRDRSGILPDTDDIGASILRWFGHRDPPAHGYVGRNLDFLFSA